MWRVSCESPANTSEHEADLIAALSLKAPMHSFVVRVALRQHCAPTASSTHDAPESVFAQNVHRQNCPLENDSRMRPLLVRGPNHSTFNIGSTAVDNFEIGSMHLCILWPARKRFIMVQHYHPGEILYLAGVRS